METKDVNESELQAKDFCFFLERDTTDGDTIAYFCPIKFFKENGSMSDEYYDALDQLVPEDMDEMAENCFASARPLDEIEKQLLSLGFQKNEEFCEFMESLDETPNVAEA